jgi:Flp pilus assembly protein TadG
MRRAAHRMRPRDERGSIAVEVAVIAPAFVMLMLLVVLAGRVSEAEAQLNRATSEAARAASLRQHPSDAAHDADLVAHDNLTAAGVRCEILTVDTDLDEFRAGGRVAVTVTCVASMSDVTLLGVPGQRTFSSRSVEVIDRYRGGGS